jgi:hypothetical protein
MWCVMLSSLPHISTNPKNSNTANHSNHRPPKLAQSKVSTMWSALNQVVTGDNSFANEQLPICWHKMYFASSTVENNTLVWLTFISYEDPHTPICFFLVMGLFEWPITKECDQSQGTPKICINRCRLLLWTSYIDYKTITWNKRYTKIFMVLFVAYWELGD